MGQEPQTMQDYKIQRETDWNAYKNIHGILDPGYLTRTDYMDKYDRDHASLLSNIKSRQSDKNDHSQNRQSGNKSENRHDDSDMQGGDSSKNKRSRKRRNKRSKNKQNADRNDEATNHTKKHDESANPKTDSQKSAEKGDKENDKKSGENKKHDNSEKLDSSEASRKHLETESAKSKDKKESKQTAKPESNNSKKDVDASKSEETAKPESHVSKKDVDAAESEELFAQSSTMLDNDQAEVSSKSLGSMIRQNKKQNKQNKNDKPALSNLNKKLNEKSESATSYLRDFPTEVKDYAIKKVGEMVRSDGFTGDLKLIDDLSKNQTNLVVMYIMSQMDDEYFNNCSNRTDISDQLIEAARAVRSFKKSQESAKKPPMARDAKRAKEYSRDTYYLAEEILRLLALQFGTTKMKFQAGETDVAEGSIPEMNKINFNMDFVKSMMVALQQQTQADLEKARLRKGSNSISATRDYDKLI